MTTDSSSGPGSSFNPAIAVPSRTYAAFRGASKDAFPADREAASELRKALDGMQVDEVIRENAAALVRAVDFLAQEHLQFADLGGGRPMQGLDQRKLPTCVRWPYSVSRNGGGCCSTPTSPWSSPVVH